MWIPEDGVRRYAVLAVLMTLVWGVTFGLLDRELDEAGNWLFALAMGAVFAGIIAVADRARRGR
jgi:hypothetical protein